MDNGYNDDKKPTSLRMIIIAVIAFIVVAAGVSVFFIIRNNLNNQARVVSVKNYPAELPVTYRENVGFQLKELLKSKFDASENSIIEATIRSDSVVAKEDHEINSVEFLIDIDEYQQTYLVSVGWSDTVEMSDDLVIACTDKSQSKYPDAFCKSMYNSTADFERIEKYPLYEKLPISVDYFDASKRRAVHYEIRGAFDDEDKLVLTVVDYSGGNLEPAKTKLKELGFNADDYQIKYDDLSGGF